jgi:S-adenosylmethionine hydrolase
MRPPDAPPARARPSAPGGTPRNTTMPAPIITFLSDFGHDDWFVGVVHGVLHGICPDARVVDLLHTIDPGDIGRAAFVLEATANDFPPGTIHIAVVDPGVGTDRRGLAISARGQWFVGPDNGVLEWALADPDAEARALADDRHFRHPVSRTFHGRDVFAPVAAHLACGTPFASLGPVVADPVRLERRAPTARDGRIEGSIAYVDRFGNALTDVTGEVLATAFAGVPDERVIVTANGVRIRGLARTYGDAPIGTLVALVGSSDRLELAEVGGDACARFGFGVGDPLVVTTEG